MTKLELLAPARDIEVGRQAILHGADAVYIGGPSHGARAAAGNSVADIARLVDFAHGYGVRVYVTLNTIVYDAELPEVEKTVGELYRIGVDALIVQDMGLLRLDIPPIALHASTQCDIRTPDKALFLARCGFSQLVLPREFSLSEIEDVRRVLPSDVSLEAFVHGALCVSYSGDCQASYVCNGRSANRGQCAQMCRMAYDLVDGDGNVLMRDKHLLSLRDLNRLDDVHDLALAGVSSFKIEGRLKDAAYVKNVVAAYRVAIDRVIDAYPDRFGRASLGMAQLEFVPDVAKAFNRGFTSYFLRPDSPAIRQMANLDTPKHIGQPVGEVIRTQGKALVAKLDQTLNNGDGLGYFDREQRFCGFRLNRVEGNRLFPASDVRLEPGTVLYRNSDTRHEAMMGKPTAQRVIGVDMQLWHAAASGRLALRLTVVENRGLSVVATMDCKVDVARSPQRMQREKALSKLGDTSYALAAFDDQLGDMDFVPASVLAELRRQACALLDREIRIAHRYDYRRAEDHDAKLPQGQVLTYHDNVANARAEEFYRDHGVVKIERALEAARPDGKEKVVMTTRYCLRRELGACLKTSAGSKLPKELYIKNRAAAFRLEFDCRECRMRVKAQSPS